MKTLQTLTVKASAIAGLVADVDNITHIVDTTDVSTETLEYRLKLHVDALQNARRKLRVLRRKLNEICREDSEDMMPALVIANLSAMQNLRRAYAQAQGMYSPGTLEAEYGNAGPGLAASLVRLFEPAGYDCGNWKTYLATNSFAFT